jgi:hypothetical protein
VIQRLKTTRSVADGIPTQERGNEYEYEYECEKTTRQSKVDGTLTRARGTHPQDARASHLRRKVGRSG